MITELQDNVGTLSGSIIAALFILGALISKFRVWWTKDTTEAAIAAATTAIIASLRDENSRLHAEIMRLQQEVAKMQVLNAEMSAKLAQLEIRDAELIKANELARNGFIDRRKTAHD